MARNTNDTNAPSGALYEVMVDSIGPDHRRGDLVRAGELPWDFDWLAGMGSVRPAPEYEGSGLTSTTQPVEGAPSRPGEYPQMAPAGGDAVPHRVDGTVAPQQVNLQPADTVVQGGGVPTTSDPALATTTAQPEQPQG